MTYSYAVLTSIVSIMIVTLGLVDMRTRWNRQPLLESLMLFLPAVRERVSRENHGLNLRMV
jgi:hypothetical protein